MPTYGGVARTKHLSYKVLRNGTGDGGWNVPATVSCGEPFVVKFRMARIGEEMPRRFLLECRIGFAPWFPVKYGSGGKVSLTSPDPVLREVEEGVLELEWGVVVGFSHVGVPIYLRVVELEEDMGDDYIAATTGDKGDSRCSVTVFPLSHVAS